MATQQMIATSGPLLGGTTDDVGDLLAPEADFGFDDEAFDFGTDDNITDYDKF
jgi:hypothetical protein